MTATTADSAQGPGSVRPAGLSSLAADRAFIGGSALLFAACTAATVRWCWSTSQRMPMPGGGLLAEAAAFVGVWAVMMVAMMLPSFVPALLGYRRLLREAHVRQVGTPTVLAGVGYFMVWASSGAVVHLLGLGLMTAEMRWPVLAPLVPQAGGVVLLGAGALQLTAWKTRKLECCRGGLLCGRAPSGTGWSAYRDGVRYGVHCCLCCAGFMLALLVSGMMDLGAVAGIAALITLERGATRPEHAARAAGIILLATVPWF
jgi:predicted metal-binding membrane protein